jgi:DNA polymerase/3'-5' exonuclease PolX
LKTADFENRQKLRSDELAALKQAVDIMKSQGVKGSGEKHLPTLLQYHRERKVSFAQLRSVDYNPLQQRISAFLAGRAKTIDSRLLSMVSQRVAADPFTKVKKMIKDLISKLMQEGTEETEHKGWCDTELGTNKITRDKKSADIAKLTSDVEDLTAQIAQLGQDL